MFDQSEHRLTPCKYWQTHHTNGAVSCATSFAQSFTRMLRSTGGRLGSVHVSDLHCTAVCCRIFSTTSFDAYSACFPARQDPPAIRSERWQNATLSLGQTDQISRFGNRRNQCCMPALSELEASRKSAEFQSKLGYRTPPIQCRPPASRPTIQSLHAQLTIMDKMLC